MKFLFAILLLLAPLRAQIPQFQNGDTVVFLGDSITHSRKWHKYVMDYYLTQLPDRKIGCYNAGISGDTAAGALRRLDRDVLAYHPTTVVTMLGMNDVKRNLYEPGTPTALTLTKRKAALDSYAENMRKIALRLKEAGVRDQIFVVSSPFDDTSAIDTPNLPGVNAALRDCGVFLRQLAAEVGGTVVDFQAPMTALNLSLQKRDPGFTLVGKDRVHPGDPGMLVMAYLFLKEQNLPQTRLQDALPMPVEKSARAALDWIPFQSRFNALKFPDVKPGRYELQLDSISLGTFDAESLRAGIAPDLTATPQYKAAEAITARNEERRQAMVTLRDILKFEEMVPAPVTDEKVEAWLAKLRESKSPQVDYYAGLAAKYKNVKPQEEAIKNAITSLANSLNQPRNLIRWPLELIPR